MNNQSQIDKLLNKKFKKSIFSGYDALDVDKFFDEVIEYVKNITISNGELKDKDLQLVEENNSLHNQCALLQQKNNELSNELKKYADNGYINVIKNKERIASRKKEEK